MTTSPSGGLDAPALALGGLGAALLDAGYAVTDVQRILRDVAAMQGQVQLTVGVLPGAVLVDDAAAGHVRMVESSGTNLTFDQVAEVAGIARDAQLGRIELWALDGLLADMRDRSPRFRPALAVLGSGLMTAGIAVVFRTNWWAVGVTFVLAMLVGMVLIHAGRSARLVAVLPFFAAFAVSTVVYALTAQLQWGTVTLFVVCAPLVILIPGATITTGVLELAAGDVVSGGGRFVSGLILWATLALGIAAGGAVVGVSPTASTRALGDPVPGWAAGPAIVVLSIGVGLFFSAAWPLIGVLTAVLALTYGIVVSTQMFVIAPVASGIAAAIMLPALRLLEVHRPRWPASLTFRPAFWLLVPGSLGLVAVSDLSDSTGTVSSSGLLASVAATVVALAVGVQIGALLSTLVRPGRA